jgi:hypothetical protein
MEIGSDVKLISSENIVAPPIEIRNHDFLVCAWQLVEEPLCRFG